MEDPVAMSFDSLPDSKVCACMCMCVCVTHCPHAGPQFHGDSTPCWPLSWISHVSKQASNELNTF